MVKIRITFVISIIFCMLQSCNLKKDPNNGTIEEFYSNGSIKSESPIKNGLRNGLVKNYSEQGRLLSTAEYVNDYRNGWVINYSTENGKPMLKAMFKDDIQQGPVIQYYKEGMLFRESTYVKGRVDGVVKTFWPDGKIKAENYFKMGKPAIGLKEFDNKGNLITKYPQIVIEVVDQTAIVNKAIVTISLSENADEIEFFLDDLFEGKYIPDNAYKLRVNDGIAYIDYPVPSGSAFKKKISIIAKFRTELGNTKVLQRYYNLSLVNNK
jgi:hypothetical protein